MFKEDESIGSQLKRYRYKNGLKSGELAQRLGIHRSIYSQYENNKVVPKPENMKKIIELLNSDNDIHDEIANMIRKAPLISQTLKEIANNMDRINNKDQVFYE